MAEVPGVNSAMLASMQEAGKSLNASDSAGHSTTSDNKGVNACMSVGGIGNTLSGKNINQTASFGSMDEGWMSKISQDGGALGGDFLASLSRKGSAPMLTNELVGGIQGKMPDIADTGGVPTGFNISAGAGVGDTKRSGGQQH